MSTPREIIEKSFNASICRYLLDSFHRTLYINCKNDFKLFYFKLKTPQRIIINNWIVECLIQYNLWQSWHPEDDNSNITNI